MTGSWPREPRYPELFPPAGKWFRPPEAPSTHCKREGAGVRVPRNGITTMTPYVFLDTNIYIRYLTQGKPGCEEACFQELKELIESGKVGLLLPEVVRLELDKFWRGWECTVEAKFKKLKTALESGFAGNKDKWNELDDVPGAIFTALDDKKCSKLETALRHYQQLEDLFRSQAVVYFTRPGLARLQRFGS